MSNLFALAYASNELIPFDKESLRLLESKAREKNGRLGITGYLCHLNGSFLQYLEGEEECVLELMKRIERDERHSVVNIVYLENLDERVFPNWRMRYLHRSEFSTIELEDILEQVLFHMKEAVYEKQRIQAMVLRLVGKIAGHWNRAGDN